ncbi:hypothetical protein [Paenirhodobacter sp.]|uniref:hypothetical protein n=1 Tax=Paenirhodobacter sp. TaxID=1965326 RepID=UPI003B515345
MTELSRAALAAAAGIALLSACLPGSRASVWPSGLRVMGEGYPVPAAPCRRLGESAATVDYLDDTRDLVGCPTRADAEALGGQIVGQVEAVTLVSMPRRD